MDYSDHPFADLIDMTYGETEEGGSVCLVPVSKKLMNPQKVVHGGVIYSMADTGMGMALYPLLNTDEFCATVEIKITYFSAVYDGEMRCDTTILKKGKRMAFMESTISANDTVIAKASGSFSIFKPSNVDKR